MLTRSDLDFTYPENLVATKAVPRGQSRILMISRDRDEFKEVSWSQFLNTFHAGDTLVFNDSKVLWARLLIHKAPQIISGVTTQKAPGEIFFLKTLGSPKKWEVLSRALNLKADKVIDLPGGLKAKVIRSAGENARTSDVEIVEPASFTQTQLAAYFEKYGHVPLPPYIARVDESEDRSRYQNIWAKEWGSVAAPTAGLHFAQNHLDELTKHGVKIAYVTLHVGAGTFLPIDTESLSDFKIHSEVINVPQSTCKMILETQSRGKRVWACGTTVLRALETAVQASSTAGTRLPLIEPFYGETKLFVTPGYQFLVVNGLLTNFHQPQSTLLALAAAFASTKPASSLNEEKRAVDKLLRAYAFAISKNFRLFSYGDLTVLV